MKSPLNPLRKLCCISTAEADPPIGENIIEDEVVAAPPSQLQPLPIAVVETESVEPKSPVVITVEPKKGHVRSPSEVASTVTTAQPTTPKVSRSSSSTSSYHSSASVVTAIEKTPSKLPKTKEENEDVTSPATPPKPMVTSPMASQESEEASPMKSAESTLSKKPEPAKELKKLPRRMEVPDDVKALDKLKKLSEIVDGEKFDLSGPFWDRISIFFGDITKIQVDAIVNAANDRLGGGGGVDGAIHRAAGYNQLQAECKKHDRPVPTGQAVITGACNLSTHIKNIIHCVGPICYGGVTAERRAKLLSCYRRAIEISEENELRSIAFCCISTGIYGYDNKDAAKTVLKFLWKYLNKPGNAEKWDRIVLCLFMDIDKKSYNYYLMELLRNPNFFDEDEESEEEEQEDDEKKEEKKKEEDEDKKEEEKKKEEDNKEDDDKKEEKNAKDDGVEKKDDKKEEDKESKNEVGVGTEKDEQNNKDESETDGATTKDDIKDESKENEKVDEKKEDTLSHGDNKDDTTKKSTVVESKNKEEAASSTSNTRAEENEALGKGADEEEEGEKENSGGDGQEAIGDADEVPTKKRALTEEIEEGAPPVKKDKPERESAV